MLRQPQFQIVGRVHEKESVSSPTPQPWRLNTALYDEFNLLTLRGESACPAHGKMCTLPAAPVLLTDLITIDCASITFNNPHVPIFSSKNISCSLRASPRIVDAGSFVQVREQSMNGTTACRNNT